MKKQLLFLFSMISLHCHSQIIFEKGYYIDDSDRKVECLIKNVDWRNNPTEFEYKLSENEDSQKATIKSVKEFGVYDASKYLRYTVKIDRSSEKLDAMSTEKEPVFNKEQLFLNVLIEGKASLYTYEDKDLRRYFYKVEDSNVDQLVFKSYKSGESNIGKNNAFRLQLWNDLKCPKILMADVEKIEYNKKELVDLFVKYNECNNAEFTNFKKKQKRNLFNLNIRLGVNSSSLVLENVDIKSLSTDFGSKLGPRIGIEGEFILPVNKNKWALLVEPTYQQFTSDVKTTLQDVKVDYKSLELPMGIRYYMFLSERSKVFVNASFIWFLNLNPRKVEFEVTPDLDLKNGTKVAFGAGYKYNNRYSLEVRYALGHRILDNYVYWSSDYKTLSVVFGYSIFRANQQ